MAFDIPIRKICEKSKRERASTVGRSVPVCINAPITEGALGSLCDSILSSIDRDAQEKEKLFGRDDC